MSNQNIRPPTPREQAEVNEATPLLNSPSANEPYSVFTPTQKRLIILAAAMASSFSPLSANIYYPALNSIAKDLGVSASQINLTIMTYMVTPPRDLYIQFKFADIACLPDMPGPRPDVDGISCRSGRP